MLTSFVVCCHFIAAVYDYFIYILHICMYLSFTLQPCHTILCYAHLTIVYYYTCNLICNVNRCDKVTSSPKKNRKRERERSKWINKNKCNNNDTEKSYMCVWYRTLVLEQFSVADRIGCIVGFREKNSNFLKWNHLVCSLFMP